jgi:hypothetical protein
LVFVVDSAPGEPRRINNAMLGIADVFPDGRLSWIFGKDLFIAENDGSNPRKLASLPALLEEIWVSPDGEHILLGGDKRPSRWVPR